MDLGIIALKGCSAFLKAPLSLEPHHQIDLCHIQDTYWRSLTPLQRCSWCILQPPVHWTKHLLGPCDRYLVISTNYTPTNKWQLFLSNNACSDSYISIYIYAHISMRVYICIHMRTHTHIHTHTYTTHTLSLSLSLSLSLFLSLSSLSCTYLFLNVHRILWYNIK